MNIQILDSWLREYLKTKAKPKELAKLLSLSSVSVERMNEVDGDIIYDIEVTTNRPDLMSVVGIAQETAAVLKQAKVPAEFIPPHVKEPKIEGNEKFTVHNDPKFITRICAAVLEVNLQKSPELIQKRLEASGIRSLNNLIDVTNYIMREMGHPSHVFDYDRLQGHELTIRLSEKGETITTLDGKTYILKGGDIIATDTADNIVDLIGIMGLENSVVTEDTKRIVLFLDNNNPHLIRKTSMGLGIRTEAAVLNEKNVDPELAYKTLLRGIELYQEIANGKVISKIIDIYPNKKESQEVSVSFEKINHVIGVEIPSKKVEEIMSSLGFKTKTTQKEITVIPPSPRAHDIQIPEDIIEEVARIYGYYNLPSILPPLTEVEFYNQAKNEFYWEKRIKNAFKYWGFTEVYTYSMVGEDMLEVAPDEAVTIANPLNEELVYLRTTLIPNLLQVVRENKSRESLKIFELSKIYPKRQNNLPIETIVLAGAIKKPHASFFEGKGVIEELLKDLGIKNYEFKKSESGGDGADIYVGKTLLGTIEQLDDEIVDFELNFEVLQKHATLTKKYTPVAKFPPIIEDVSIVVDPKKTYTQIVETIQSQNQLIRQVELLDRYENKKTFRITYQNYERNLTDEDIAPIREKVIRVLEKELGAKVV